MTSSTAAPATTACAGRVGRDELRGGLGFDEAWYLDRAQRVTISLNGVADDGADGESDNVFADVEELQGGAGDDVLTGDDRPNALHGEAGPTR